jgi:hypothetical protein
MAIGDKYYRFEDRKYASEEFGFFSRVRIDIMEFNVVKETSKGVWIETSLGLLGKRFVLHDARKKYAHPTMELAKESFIARKKKQMKIYNAKLKDVKHALLQVGVDT